MAANPLDAIVRVHKLALDQARKDLAFCSRAEQKAQRAAEEATSAIEVERRVAHSLSTAVQPTQEVSLWFRSAQRAASYHSRRQDAASVASTKARKQLIACHEANKIAEQLTKSRQLARRAEIEKREQFSLQDTVRLARSQVDD